MKKFSLLFAFLLHPVWAQPSPPPAEKVNFNFSVFPLESGNWREIFYSPVGDPSEEAVQLSFNTRERSRNYSYDGPLPLRFFRWTTDAQGNRIPQVLGSIQPKPEEKKGPLILFFEPPQDTGLHRISVLHDAGENFPNESIMFFNTMDVDFFGALGGKQIAIPPGKSGAVSFREYLNNEVPIALAIRHEGDIHLVANNNIRFSADRRILMILRPPGRPGSLRIRTQRLTEYTGARGEEETPPNPENAETP